LSSVFVRFNAAGLDPPVRAPLLERLLARADSHPSADWRSEAYRMVVPGAQTAPPVAPAAAASDLQDPGGGTVFIAAALHCVAGMTNVRLAADGLLRLDPAEAADLARRFNADFGGRGSRLLAGRSGRLYCVFDGAIEATTHDPGEFLGRDVFDFLPAGRDSSLLRGLMSEMEMWLFERASGRARGQDGRLSPTGLWLWGGGEVLPRLPPLGAWTAGVDPLWSAWRPRAEFPADPSTPGIIVLDERPGEEAWTRAEAQWLRPALAALRAGRIHRIELSAADRGFHLGARWSWRLWRRSRPWWEHFV
jgi:hypothetical protein